MHYVAARKNYWLFLYHLQGKRQAQEGVEKGRLLNSPILFDIMFRAILSLLKVLETGVPGPWHPRVGYEAFLLHFLEFCILAQEIRFFGTLYINLRVHIKH